MKQLDNIKIWESFIKYKRLPIEMRHAIHLALKDQGLKWNGKEIVSIEPKPFVLEVGKWYECIKDFITGTTCRFREGLFYLCEIYECLTDDQGFKYNSFGSDAAEYFRPATEEEIPHEPKFKVGDWIVEKHGNHKVQQIKEIDNDGKVWFTDGTGTFIEFIEDSKLWTIADAKDGDVLVTLDYILIFKEHLKDNGGVSHCHYDFTANTPQFNWNEDRNWYFGKEAVVCPATKEQRDLLFSKMKEAGYEWDADKKELKELKKSQRMTSAETKDAEGKLDEMIKEKLL